MAYQGGRLSNGTPLNVAVYNAYVNAGLSHNQALAVTAEVGRENSFNANVLFGNHIDPARDKNGNKIRNLGMLSWNQGRDNMLEGFLKQNGVMKNGVMEQTQANLDAQARFSVREMKSKRYASKLKNFWGNPNANPDTYAAELGKHYIAWAYGQNDIKGKVAGTREPFDWKANDNRRRGYLNTLSGMLGGNANYQSQSEPSWQAPEWETQEWQAPSWQEAEQPQWQEPEWQTASQEPSTGFVEPEWQQPESTFTAPEWQSTANEQVPVRDLTDNEPSAWQPPQWETLEQEPPISAMQPRQI